MKPRIDGGTVLVTGASSGIGRELARQLAGSVAALVLVARRGERLRELASELTERHPELTVSVQPCDLTDPDATENMLAKVSDEVGRVDVLINNAGMGYIEFLEYNDWAKIEMMLRINMMALTHLTYRLLKPMLAAGRGAILNVSSGFGLYFCPGMAAYAGSKHYVTAFTESLRGEVAGSGVVVSQVCPGPVATEFDSVAGTPGELNILQKLVRLTPERCARITLRRFRRGRALIIPGFRIGLALWLGRLLPRFINRFLQALIFGRIGRKRRARLGVQTSDAPSQTEHD